MRWKAGYLLLVSDRACVVRQLVSLDQQSAGMYLMHCLSGDRSIACSKTSSPKIAIYCLLFQISVYLFSLRSFSGLLTPSSSSSLSFCVSFNNVF